MCHVEVAPRRRVRDEGAELRILDRDLPETHFRHASGRSFAPALLLQRFEHAVEADLRGVRDVGKSVFSQSRFTASSSCGTSARPSALRS